MVFIHRYKGYYLCNYDFGFALRQVGDNISMRRLLRRLILLIHCNLFIFCYNRALP